MGAWQAAGKAEEAHNGRGSRREGGVLRACCWGWGGAGNPDVGTTLPSWLPPKRRYSDSCCPWRIWGLAESELETLSPYRLRGPLPQPTPLSWGHLGGGAWERIRDRSTSHNGNGSEISGRLRISQAELVGWVKGGRGSRERAQGLARADGQSGSRGRHLNFPRLPSSFQTLETRAA